jgi:hypothetical protein
MAPNDSAQKRNAREQLLGVLYCQPLRRWQREMRRAKLKLLEGRLVAPALARLAIFN